MPTAIPRRLVADEQQTLAHIPQHEVVNVAYNLALHFSGMVRKSSSTILDNWLIACVDSQIPDFQGLATRLRRSSPSVRVSLTEKWSDGQLEGQVNGLKLVKGRMYGLAGFDLLRQRVLYPA